MRDFNFSSIPKPIISDEILTIFHSGDFDLEIGAGQGLHAIRYCQMHPERQLVAIERTHTKAHALMQRARSHPHLNGLTAIHGDAIAIVSHYVPTASVQNLFLLYPNPYPKGRHSNLRWHNQPFMRLLREKLRPGGRLILATNIESYAQEAKAQMVSTWQFHLNEFSQISPTTVPRTHFEKKYLARGHSCWNLVFSKP